MPHLLVELLVGPAHHRHLGDGFMRGKHSFNLGRVDLGAAANVSQRVCMR
jgi:hypothetical protein